MCLHMLCLWSRVKRNVIAPVSSVCLRTKYAHTRRRWMHGCMRLNSAVLFMQVYPRTCTVVPTGVRADLVNFRFDSSSTEQFAQRQRTHTPTTSFSGSCAHVRRPMRQHLQRQRFLCTISLHSSKAQPLTRCRTYSSRITIFVRSCVRAISISTTSIRRRE